MLMLEVCPLVNDRRISPHRRGTGLSVAYEAFGDARNEAGRTSFRAFFIYKPAAGGTGRLFIAMCYKTNLILAFASAALLCGCSGNKLSVKSLGYQSVRTDFRQETQIPEEAKIAVMYVIDTDGSINAVVKNLTTEILTIDQTKSFFIDTNGTSTSYYDPTVTASSNSSFSSQTEGTAFNLGGLANGLGVGGFLGHMMNSTTLSSSGTTGTVNTVTTYMRDMPQVSLGPLGSGVMSKVFRIGGIGSGSLSSADARKGEWSKADSPLRFSVCITYSVGDGNDFQKIVTNFYVSSSMVVDISRGKINEAFREIYKMKPDALYEPTYLFCLSSNLPSKGNVYDRMRNGVLVDFQ